MDVSPSGLSAPCFSLICILYSGEAGSFVFLSIFSFRYYWLYHITLTLAFVKLKRKLVSVNKAISTNVPSSGEEQLDFWGCSAVMGKPPSRGNPSLNNETGIQASVQEVIKILCFPAEAVFQLTKSQLALSPQQKQREQSRPPSEWHRSHLKKLWQAMEIEITPLAHLPGTLEIIMWSPYIT